MFHNITYLYLILNFKNKNHNFKIHKTGLGTSNDKKIITHKIRSTNIQLYRYYDI